MNPIEKAKSMLPNMPDEVFDTWLRPIILNHNGWPYSSIFAPHPDLQWKRYFALFTLHDVHNCMWYKMLLTFDIGCLDPLSNRTIDVLIKSHVYNLDITLNVRDSRSRFFGFVEFIRRTRSIPAPVIGINTNAGLRILDGNHRLAALTYLGLRGCIQCAAWVGAPNVQ